MNLAQSKWGKAVMRYRYTAEYIAVVVTVLLLIEIVKMVRPT